MSVEDLIVQSDGHDADSERDAPDVNNDETASSPVPPITLDSKLKSQQPHPKPTEDQDRTDKDLKAQQDMARWAGWEIIVGFVQVGLTILALFYIARTLKVSREATDAAKTAAIAAADGARVAQNSVDVTSDTAKRQLRAYLTVVDCKLDWDGSKERIIVSAILKNSGVTPAFNVRVKEEAFHKDLPLGEEIPHPEPGPSFGAPIGAGGNIHSTAVIETREVKRIMDSVMAGKSGLWIQGTAIYDDCFDKEHRTQFRYVFQGPLPGSSVIAWKADKEGNSAD